MLGDILDAYCISLEDATERREEISSLAKKLNIQIQFKIYKPVVGNGPKGCFESHINTIKDFVEESSKSFCLIFEDDATLASQQNIPTHEKIIEICNNSTDILFLGGFITIPRNLKKIKEGMFNTNHIFGSEAMLIKRQTAEALMNEEFDAVPIDLFYAKYKNSAILLPSVFKQNHESSYIRKYPPGFALYKGVIYIMNFLILALDRTIGI